MRNATAYGASPRQRFDLVVNDLAATAYLYHEIRMSSDGTPWRPFVHVLDIAKSVACVLEAPRDVIHDEIFNVGSDTSNYQIRQIAEIIGGLVPGCAVQFGDSSADKRNYRADFTKISTQLPGFALRVGRRARAPRAARRHRRASTSTSSCTASGATPGSPRSATCSTPSRSTTTSSGRPAHDAPVAPVTVCRSCGGTDLRPVLDLGSTPIANALVDPARRPAADPAFPLAIVFCPDCTLVQLGYALPADAIFDEEYPYFSSFSDALMAHAAEHVAGLIATRGLGPGSFAVEVASNDGYLLRNFVAAGIRTLGIDPSPGPAAAAEEVGVPTIVGFFGVEQATADACRARSGRRDRRQQRDGPRARPQRLRRRLRRTCSPTTAC